MPDQPDGPFWVIIPLRGVARLRSWLHGKQALLGRRPEHVRQPVQLIPRNALGRRPDKRGQRRRPQLPGDSRVSLREEFDSLGRPFGNVNLNNKVVDTEGNEIRVRQSPRSLCVPFPLAGVTPPSRKTSRRLCPKRPDADIRGDVSIDQSSVSRSAEGWLCLRLVEKRCNENAPSRDGLDIDPAVESDHRAERDGPSCK